MIGPKSRTAIPATMKLLAKNAEERYQRRRRGSRFFGAAS